MIFKGAKAQIASLDVDSGADTLVAVDWRGAVSCWSLSDGALRWQTDVDTTRGQAVLLDGARVYVTTAGGRVLCLDRDTGDARNAVDGIATCNGHDALVRCGAALVCFGDARGGVGGCVTALDADSLAVRWQREAGDRFRGADADAVYTVPLRYDGRAVLRAIEAATGAMTWERACAAVPVSVDAARGRVALGESAWTAFASLDDPMRLTSACIPRGVWQAELPRFSPEGARLAAHDGFSVAFLDVASGAVTPSTVRHTRNVGPLRWSADGAILYSGSWDKLVRAHPALR